jgi:hypothetical protein
MRKLLGSSLALIFIFLAVPNLLGQCFDCSLQNPTNLSSIPNNTNVCITSNIIWSDVTIGDNVKICIANGASLTIQNNLTTTVNHSLKLDVSGELRFAQKPTFRSNLQLNVRTTGKLVIGTEANPSDIEFIGAQTKIYNNGLMVTNVLGFLNNSSINEIENSSQGTLDIRANININGQTNFENFGELNIRSSYNNNASSTYINCGVINAQTGFNLGGGVIINSGTFNHGNGQLDMTGSSKMENYGEFTSLGTINGGSNAVIHNEGLMRITTVQPNGMRFEGPSSQSKMGYFFVINSINPNGAKVGPNLDFTSYSAGFAFKSINQNQAQIFANTPVYVNAEGNTTTADLANVRFDCEGNGNCSGVMITHSDCVAIEYFDETTKDTDGDGIPDYLDNDADGDGIPNNVECPPMVVSLNSFQLLTTTGTSTNNSNFVVGDKMIRKSATIRGGVEYDAIATIIAHNLTGSANVGLTSAGSFALKNGISTNNPYMQFKIEFVKSGTVNTSNDVVVPQTLRGITIILKDVDGNGGTQHFTDVVGYRTASNPSLVTIGSLLTNQGFANGTGPGNNFTYYRASAYVANSNGVENAPDSDERYWVSVEYNEFTSNEFVFGLTGTRTNAVGERASFVDGAFSFASCDTDGDGIPDYLDLDSDNDGIPDLVEAGGTDADGNGIADDLTDANGNGIPDTYDPAMGGTAIGTLDSDGDGVPNQIDLDSDNDGIPDYIESQSQADYENPTPYSAGVDTNGDGWIDSYVGNTPVDTDGDGIPDYLDLDSDGDGIFDLVEFTYDGDTLLDANNDGRVDTPVGSNGLVDTRDSEDGYENPNGDILDPMNGGGDANGNGIWDYREVINQCSKPSVAGTAKPTNIGINTYKEVKDNWPYAEPNGFISLESSNKGFVITRVAHVSFEPTPTDSIEPSKVVEGMLVYDIQDACVKLFNGTNWNCIRKCQ